MKVKKRKGIIRVWRQEDEDIVRCPRCKGRMRNMGENIFKCFRCSFGRTSIEYK